MSQGTTVLPTVGTVSGLTMTQDTNAALDTLNTLWSGASAPGSPEAGQFWHDTTNNILKLRSLDNTTWIPLFYLSESSYLAGPPSLGQVNGGLNRVLNGAMAIDQVNEGASYSIPVNNTFTYTADQWQVVCNNVGTTVSGLTAQRVTDAPAGFTNSLKVTVGTGGAIGTNDYLMMVQPIEANNLSDLNYGTVNAVATSLSFWVKSSVTGTFAAVLQNAAGNRAIVQKFTIGSAGTWTQITMPNLPGDQSGSWASGSSAMMNLFITAACGSFYQSSTLGSWLAGAYYASNTQTNTVFTTSGATFQVGGVMLNAGAFCQPYEKRTIQSELFLLQRYYEKSYDAGTTPGTASNFLGADAAVAGGTSMFMTSRMKSTKRVDPTIALYSTNSGASGKVFDGTSVADVSATVPNIGQNGFISSFTSTAGHISSYHWTASARM